MAPFSGTTGVSASRWQESLPGTADYYYDEPTVELTKRSTKLPPDKMDFSDTWVVAILKLPAAPPWWRYSEKTEPNQHIIDELPAADP